MYLTKNANHLSPTSVQTGDLLIAEPFMMDPNFRRAVILLCDHHEQGTLGFILNRPTGVPIHDILDDFPNFDAQVHLGGPVQTDTLHYIHNVGDLLEDSIKVFEGTWWGGDFDKLRFLIQSELIQPHNIRFFVGYTGWSPGQLQTELQGGSWVTGHMDANYAFKINPAHLWQKAMYDKGRTFEVLAAMPDGPCWN